MRQPRTAVLAAVTLTGGLLLGACSNSGEFSSSGVFSGTQPAASASAAASGGGFGAGSAAGAAAPSATAAGRAASEAVPEDQKAAGGTSTTSGSNAAAQATQRLIRTAEITVEVQVLATSASRVRQIALDLGGLVASETTGYAAAAKPVTVLGSDGQPTQRAAVAGQSVIVVRVPEGKLDQALDRLAGANLGKELSRTTNSQDVTSDIADATSRVATQKASVARIRELLAKAASLKDITYLESELTSRESELEALEARIASLTDRATYSTLTVVLQTPQVQPPPAPEPVNDSSFLKGLHAGWDAVVASMTVVLTVLGALLPLVIVLVLVGGPIYLLARRLRRTRPGTASNGPSNGSSGGPGAGPWFPGQPAGPADPAGPTGPKDPAGPNDSTGPADQGASGGGGAPVPVGAGTGGSAQP